MVTHTHRGRQALAVVGAFALGLAGLFGLSSAAHAKAPGPGGVDMSVTDGSIIIHKHAASGPNASGNPKTGVFEGGAPIDGAGFTVWPIKSIDLSKSDHWDKLEGLGAQVMSSKQCGITGETLDNPLPEVVTRDGGIATVGGLKPAAYLVCETKLPVNASVGSAPFIVTVPSPYDGLWLYNVHVFPKNTLNIVEKTVDAQNGYGIGSTVKFNVSTTINPLPNGDPYTSFIVADTLDPRLSEAKVESVTLGDRKLVEGNGYRVEVNPSNPNALSVGVSPGLIAASPNAKITVVFSGIVREVGTGGIDNTAVLYVNDPTMTGGGVPSNSVRSSWGDLQIGKVDSADTALGLSGAVFEVYEAADPYAASCEATSPTDKIVKVGDDTTFTTGPDGKVRVKGLYVTDTSNTPNDQAGHRCYFVKETRAPAGFVTPSGNAAFTAVKVVPGTSAGVDVDIKNSKQTVPLLPLTGGAGQAALILGGLAVAGGGITAAALRRRKVAA